MNNMFRPAHAAPIANDNKDRKKRTNRNRDVAQDRFRYIESNIRLLFK
jgi:hypothetical protein